MPKLVPCSEIFPPQNPPGRTHEEVALGSGDMAPKPALMMFYLISLSLSFFSVHTSELVVVKDSGTE